MKAAAEAEAEAEEAMSSSTQLLSSLLSQIPSIPIFKSKWSMIRTNLHTLQAHLSNLTDLTSMDPLSIELLISISTTLSNASSLAHSCLDPSLTNLHTQSLLHSLLSSLHRHASHLEILLDHDHNHNHNHNHTRLDAIRARSRSLITRLQIGGPDSQISAMESLLVLLREEDKNVVVAVAQGLVPVLVRFMDSGSGSVSLREKTVAAVARVSMVESTVETQGLMVISSLIRVLDSGSGFAKEMACVALQALSVSRDNAREIGVSSLLRIAQSGTPVSQALAAGVLRNVVAVGEVRERFVEENGVVVILGLAASGTALGRENAIGCLCNLVSDDDESLKVLVVREGGVECLSEFWDSGVVAGKGLEVAVELLVHFASCPPVADLLVSCGFVARVVGVLGCGVLGVRIGGARAVCEMGSYSAKARKEMGESGCIAPLVKMMDGKAVEEKEAAAKALSVLVVYAGNRRIFRREERGIVSAVQLLDPCVHSLDKKYPVSVLASLVHSKKCRKQMVAAGACLYLHKLVEMEVQGAKKLSESLGRGKIWGVFSRP